MRRSAALLCLTLLGLPGTAPAQIQLTGGTYTQNFDSLASTGASSVVPNGWAFAESGPGADNLYLADDGSNPAGGAYSYGATGSSNRAFGTLRDTRTVANTTAIIGAQFQNSAGGALNTVTITYQGEQWRLGATGRQDQLTFQYSTNAISLTDPNATWITDDPLSFNSPNTTGPVGPLDGTANSTTQSDTITLNVPDGGTFWIRWLDAAIPGPNDGLAVDNFSLSAVAVPEPTGFALVGLAGLVFGRRLFRRPVVTTAPSAV
jgi:hypothetical protein